MEEYPTTEECSFHLFLILPDVILAVYGWVAEEAQGAKNSKSSDPAAP